MRYIKALDNNTRCQRGNDDSSNIESRVNGYIEAINWNTDRMLPPLTKTSLHLTAPDNYMVVIHFESLDADCSYYAGNMTLRSENNTMTLSICKLKKNSCTARAFYSGKVDLTYVTYRTQGNEKWKNKDCKIKFYFYPILQPPVQLSADRWSCASVNWRGVKPPWSCVFVFGCSSDEDGVGCWQGDDKHKLGLFQVDRRCFAVSQTWDKEFSANEWCRHASLNARQLLKYVHALLRRLEIVNSFLLRLRSTPSSVPVMYRHSVMWSDGTVAHFLANFKPRTTYGICVINFVGANVFPVLASSCQIPRRIPTELCQISNSLLLYQNIAPPMLSTPRFSKSNYIQCPENHFTHVFLACDEISHCWLSNNDVTSSCTPPLKSLPLFFKCADTQQSVPYTLVCNYRDDCKDGSDEIFCKFAPCDVTSSFTCDRKRCVKIWEQCDQKVDCDDLADEGGCLQKISNSEIKDIFSVQAYILHYENGDFILSEYTPPAVNTSATSLCPDSHFLCVSQQDFCLPVYLRCNGMYDCPGHEDEAACDSYTCPGFYRCRGSQVCVHESNLCDGVYHCPQRDDEILCNETCPQHCVCHGWAFICSNIIHGSSYSNLRYLDASERRMTLAYLDNHTYLVYLSLARCDLTTLHEVSLQNLRTLDLSNNKLTHITAAHFAGLTNLNILKISNNRLKAISFYDYLQNSNLNILDISNNSIEEIDFSIFSFFSNLTKLNLSSTHLNHVIGQGFPNLNDLRVIDVRFCPMTIFPRFIFKALDRLETVYADSYKLCCPATLPKGFNVINCHAPSDEVSSCDDLLRSNLYRVGLAIFAALSLVGNVCSLLYRLINRTPSRAGYDIFVTNLRVADFLMGVYLLTIGIADQSYKGVYVWEDVGWRNSIFCKMAGFLCLLSSEVSVFITFLISIDRFLVLRYPLYHLHFEKLSAQLACSISWLVGLALAVIPFLPVTSHWQFYSQTSICIPLPTSRVDFPGRGYSYGVKVILNFILCICIFIGQIFIYWSVHTKSISAACTSRDRGQMFNLLCVFLVSFAGFLASCSDVRSFEEVNIIIAIFVFPLHAALNPFLYTINIYLERRRRVRDETRRKFLMAQIKSSNNFNLGKENKVQMTRRDIHELVRTLLSIRALSPEDLTRMSEEKT